MVKTVPETIIDLLSNADEAMTTADIADYAVRKTGTTPANARNTLSRLLSDGRLFQPLALAGGKDLSWFFEA